MAQNQVKVEFINPFISSTVNAFQTMLFSEIERVGLYVKKPEQSQMAGDLSSMISLFGALKGTVALTFPRKLAIHLISKMLMDDSIDDITPDVHDGVGEISNLVGGGAKSAIAQKYQKEASISIPTLVTGKNHHMQHEKDIPCIGCVFKVDNQKFALEVALKVDDSD